MNEIQTFTYNNNTVRTVQKDGEPWFVLKDVCSVLEMDTSKLKQIADRLEPDEKGRYSVPTLGGNQETWIINESGLYNVILRSDKPEAKPFRKWVTSEVLPSIRKHGAYLTPETLEKMVMSPDFGIRLLTELKAEQDKRKALEATVEEQKPHVLFSKAVSASKTSILIGALAKLLNQNGVDIGQNRLFEWLRENGFLIKRGDARNMPTQRAMGMGLFEVKERTVDNPDGSVRVTRTTLVSGKGQIYFINRFLGAFTGQQPTKAKVRC